MQPQDPLDRVKPRILDFMPQCYECKSPDTPLLRGRPPMFHPVHKWGRAGYPCRVARRAGAPSAYSSPRATSDRLVRHRFGAALLALLQ
jgi:hypothetical protein